MWFWDISFNIPLPKLNLDLANMSTDHYLELSAYPVKFEAVSHVTNVFFDDSNKQVTFLSFYCNT